MTRPMCLPEGALLRVISGRVWLTLEGRSEDIWLMPGEEWRATAAVRVWLSAEPTARLQRLEPVPHGAEARWGRLAWHLLAGALLAHRHRHRPGADAAGLRRVASAPR
jgi:hypothetical protein